MNESSGNGGTSTVGVILFLVGVAIIIMTFVGAGRMTEYGDVMSRITLASGYDTIEEAYYDAYGEVITGFSIVLRAIGLALGLIVSYIGTQIKK